jgi:hypothetical protein
MVSGGVATLAHGEPRFTADADIVIAPSEEQIERFVGLFRASEAYVSREAVSEALRERTMFNIIDSRSGWKADLVLLKSDPFSRTEFERRRPIETLGLRVTGVSPEDLVLSKLSWGKSSPSEKQLRDVAGVLRIQRDALDLEYLRHWAKELGVAETLEALLTKTRL